MIRPTGLTLAGVVLLGASAAWAAADSPAGEEGRVSADLRAIANYREGMARIVAFGVTRPDLFPTNRVSGLRALTREQKEAVWSAWNSFLDYAMALDSIREEYLRPSLETKADRKREALTAGYAAFLAEYRYALEFIRMAEKDPNLDVLLNDPVPELGLAGGTYARLKLHALNAVRATEFLALKTVWALHRPKAHDTRIEEDAAAVMRLGVKDAQLLTADNALDIVRRTGSAAWFPVQKGVSIWMGDTKVWRKDLCLITQEQIAALAGRLQPGDILLERREWYLSNVGLPGFWPHAAIYIGTASERRRAFSDPETVAWVKAKGGPDGDFNALLRNNYPDAYAVSAKPQEEGHVPRVLEAIGEGVSFTTLEHSAGADSLAVLRTRLSAKERAVAVWRAFHYAGRPYDYNFDFATDSAIVCTELVCKSFEPCGDSRGLKFPLLNILGRLATPANELVRQFDGAHGTPEQQYDLVLFLDGQEKKRRAEEGTLDAFRGSWRRPKWHVMASSATR
jgi:hypothetical protein